MKSINIHNYEEYAIDYMSGELSVELEQAFIQFLGEQPDIADEVLLFNIADSCNVPSENINFRHLKKEISDVEINAKNFEEFCIASAEGDLSPKAEKTLESYIANSRILKQEAESYRHLKLKASKEEYPHKEALKQAEHKPLLAKRWNIASIAAAAVVILTFSFLISPKVLNNNSQQLAMTSSFKSFNLLPLVPITEPEVPEINIKAPNIEVYQKPKLLLAENKKQSAENIIKKTNTKQPPTAAEKLSKLQPLRSYSNERSTITIKDIALANINANAKITTPKIEEDESFRQLASNYIYTKVLTKGIKNINRMAETSLDYKVVENEKGEPVKVIFSTRFGELNRTLAQR